MGTLTWMHPAAMTIRGSYRKLLTWIGRMTVKLEAEKDSAGHLANFRFNANDLHPVLGMPTCTECAPKLHRSYAETTLRYQITPEGAGYSDGCRWRFPQQNGVKPTQYASDSRALDSSVCRIFACTRSRCLSAGR